LDRVCPSNLPTLPDAGKGLFAAAEFKAGASITGYQGQTISRKETLMRREAGQGSHIVRAGPPTFHSPYIDGIHAEQLKEGMWGGSACNHKDGNEANAKFVFLDMPDRVVVQTVRDVEVGEKIFVTYGHGLMVIEVERVDLF